MSTDQDAAVRVRIAGVTAVPQRTQLSQLFSAGLREVITDTGTYFGLFEHYMGIAPRYPPACDDCGGWVPAGDLDEPVRALLAGGVVRFGYVPSTPYVYGEGENRTGFDHDLAALALEKIQARYHLAPLRADWRVACLGPVTEAGRLQLLYEGLVRGDFDIAMSGQLVEAQVDAPCAHPDWTCATVQLFTGIYYSGRDAERVKPAIAELVGRTQKELVDRLANAFPDLEILVVCASNPGPSPTGAAKFVADIKAAGGQACLRSSKDVEEVKRQFMEMEVHFAVGDSNQNSALCAMPGFSGINLDIPAIDGQVPLPLAAFAPRPVP